MKKNIYQKMKTRALTVSAILSIMSSAVNPGMTAWADTLDGQEAATEESGSGNGSGSSNEGGSREAAAVTAAVTAANVAAENAADTESAVLGASREAGEEEQDAAVLGANRDQMVLGADRHPQTGQVNWPVPVLALAGLFLILTGVKYRKEEIKP